MRLNMGDMSGCLAADIVSYCFCCCLNRLLGSKGLNCKREGKDWTEWCEERERSREKKEKEENAYNPPAGDFSGTDFFHAPPDVMDSVNII